MATTLELDMQDFARSNLARAPLTTGVPATFQVQVEQTTLEGTRKLGEDLTKQIQVVDDGVTAPPTPTITTITPNSGAIEGGTNVTIDGSNFVQDAIVKYGGVLEGPNGFWVDQGRIISVTPAHIAGTVDVEVINVGTIKATKINGFTFLADPTISSVSPHYGDIAGGTLITINGSGFAPGCTGDIQGSAIGSLSFVNPTQLLGFTPAKGEGIYNIHIQNPSGQQVTNGAFHYQHVPGGFGFNPYNPFNALNIPNNSANTLSVYPTLDGAGSSTPPPWSQYLSFEGVIQFSVYRSVGVDVTFTPANGLIALVDGRATCQFTVHTTFVNGGSVQIQAFPVDYPALFRTTQYLVNF